MAWLECTRSDRDGRHAVRLRKALTTLGRDPGNDVVLEGAGVASSHAVLVRRGGAWSVSASDRTAAIEVNGRATREASLAAGDAVAVGPWRLVLHDGEPTEATRSEGVDLALLERLVTLSAEMMRENEHPALFRTLLRGLVEVTRAEKGFIILFQDGARHVVARHNVADEQVERSGISDSIVDRVAQTGEAVIVSDALHDDRFGQARSVVDLKLSSVMCVPLEHRSDLLGVIYLGNDRISGLFTDDDLTILRIYASQASLVVYHALLLRQLRVDNAALRQSLARDADRILGGSRPMQQVFRILKKVSPTDLSVLVLGETGTGKELVAQELHALSPRHGKPFVAINCGAIPENLLESELFGHRKGAFTGADTDKIGRIEAADGGTLFLDEIGEMPTNLQVKLLRVLQERVIERVGDVAPRPIDVRVIAATNRDPLAMIADGAFREDLYYRLNEVTIALPALRERGEDIVLLSQFFLKQFRERYGGRATGFTNQALLALKQHAWPGNVRQLENAVKKAVIMSDRALLNETDLGLARISKRHIATLAEAQEDFKIDYIRRVLDMNGWNKAQTARDLGVDARTIFRYIEKFDEEGGTP